MPAVDTLRRVNDPSTQEFLAESTIREHRPATIRMRRIVLENLAGYLCAPLRTASADDLHGWFSQYADAAVWTRITYGRSIQAFYGWLHDRGYRDDDPSHSLPIPSTPRGRPRPAPRQDVLLAMRYADPQMRLWVALAALAGLRAGEIARLRREHVHDGEHPPFIDVINGKGGKDGVVIIGRRLARMVAAHQRRNGRMWGVSAQRVTELVSQHFAGLGLPWTCHSLRHSFGTDTYRATKDLRFTQEQMRHRSTASTAIYTQPNASGSALDAIDQIDSILDEGESDDDEEAEDAA